MNTMILIGMGIKIASVCVVGMATSEGLNFFQTKSLKDLKGKKKKSKLTRDHFDRGVGEDERHERIYGKKERDK